ncbi:tyrosine-protein phosphatase non-receptor type 9 isoform X1 [Patella vulgata]|uniref:tyrosine-protein phosphatase non-receptor type 9 isoform X1 n=2 Tax=Patella vulgata TaxID=6465 RepID=UPI0024A9D630|nr:tyrosine-protein phosphatase non-receptor type 9 isoform X1 [Patella vulgata]
MDRSVDCFYIEQMPKLLEEQEMIIHKFLEEINYLRTNQGKTAVSSNTAVKFLMARKFDFKRAKDLFIAHENIRDREDLVYIDPSDKDLQTELYTEKFTVLPNRDHSGAAVALFTARLHYPSTTTHQITLKGLVFQLDAALESEDTQKNGLVFVYDMTDSKYANFDYELSSKILNMLKGAYPAKLKKVLIVTAPLWFKAPFKILRMFVKEKLRERVFTVDLTQLSKFLPKECLTPYFNSNIRHPTPGHKEWLELCKEVAIHQCPNMDSYFITRKRGRDSLDECDSQGSVSRSVSSDAELRISDIDTNSEASKETINEKHNHEDREKEHEIEGTDSEKEVTVEKDGTSLTGGKRRRTSGTDSDRFKRNSEISPTAEKKRPMSSGSNILDNSIHMPDDQGLTLTQLVDHVKQLKKRGLYAEYAHIKMEPPKGTFNESKARHNLPKNRYTDVLALDHSRVCLPLTDGDPNSDYINANYVDGYMQKNAYICTQGPLPKTFVDFWRMVWSNQTEVIVMTTRTIERQRMKCGQYWPNEESMDEEFEEFVVFNSSIKQHKDYIETKLDIHNKKTGEKRMVTHLQFTAWPDYGIPPATGFLDFLFHVRKAQEDATKDLGSKWQGHPLGPPIVIHCSAGIGRTGTFVTIDISLRRLDDIGTVDIRETVRRIRSQRAYSIQMPDQYVFCHLGVIDHAVRQGLLKEVEWSSLDSDTESD